MEGIERATVERASFRREEVIRAAKPYGHEVEWNFPLLSGAIFDAQADRDWVKGEDLFSGREILVPRRVAGLDCLCGPLVESAHYSTSNGLASGNTREEAVASALYELIERDGIALATVRTGPGKVIAHESIPWPSVQGLLAKINAAGCGVSLFDCMNDIAVPTFMAVLFDRAEKGVGAFRGYGAHLSPEIAMCRAVCEAAQARAVIVAGARDDISHERYCAYLAMTEEEDLSRWDQEPNTNANVHDASGASFREDIATLMERLEAAEFRRALMIDFNAYETTGAHVVRMMVPGLEGYPTPAMAYGPRAMAAMQRSEVRAQKSEEGANSQLSTLNSQPAS
jgi:ribosomal protein S12 methylthiotransferase accessory factor